MKKVLAFFLVLCSVAFSAADAVAADSYLYWMVDTDAADAAGSEWNNARISYTVDGVKSYLTLYNDAGTTAGLTAEGETYSGPAVAKSVISTYASDCAHFYAQLAIDPGYGTYVIELFNDDIGYRESAAFDYQAIASYITSDIKAPPMEVWMPTTYLVPEPNSAFLMLLGFAGLALRRRKLVVA